MPVKCPFCTDPCGNDHCPYSNDEKESQCAKIIRGLEEENKRLKEQLIEMTKWLNK